MAAALTIRNLSSRPLSLDTIESFSDPNAVQSKPKSSPFPLSNNSTPSAPSLAQHAQAFSKQELKIQLLPLESYTTKQELCSTDDSTSKNSIALRITVEDVDRERHRLDVNPSYTQKAALKFISLSPAPTSGYKALYFPGTPASHLTIHDNHVYDLSSWMSRLPSELPLSAISLPGTHNSHTHYRALPSVRCQEHPVNTQLENGIRFLDIRVMPAQAGNIEKKELSLVHGAFPVSLTGPKYFAPILQACYDFLERHSSETILISLKREGTGSSTDEQLSQILDKHYISLNREKWYLEPQIPYLRDVRGKLVLIRRFNRHESVKASPDNESYGLDATAWPHNSTHAIHGPFCVQDFCEVMNPKMIPEKLGYSKEHLARAAECTAFIPGFNTDKTNPVPAGPLYLNFLSGSNFFNVGTWPGRISLVLNREVEEWICRSHHLEHPADLEDPERQKEEGNGEPEVCTVRKVREGDGGVGVVVMDHVGHRGNWDLVRLIVGLNMAFTWRIKSSVAKQDGNSTD